MDTREGLMSRLKLRVAFLSVIVVLSPAVWALDGNETPVVIGYVDCGTPFHIHRDGELSSGLVTDVAKAIAMNAAMEPQFHEIPTKRVTSLLKNTTVEMVCFHHQDWSEDPGALVWGPELV